MPMLVVAEVSSTGKMRAARDAALEPGEELFLRQRAGVEELLHQRVVGLGDHLDQRFARRVAVSIMSPGMAPSTGLPLPSSANMHAFIATRSMTPGEGLLLADRQLDRDDGAPEHAAQRFERALEAGALAVEPVERR